MGRELNASGSRLTTRNRNSGAALAATPITMKIRAGSTGAMTQLRSAAATIASATATWPIPSERWAPIPRRAGRRATQHDRPPADETVRVYTGNAFDLVGQRRRTDYRVDNRTHWLDEAFEIKLRNHKKEPVEIRVVEHLYRWSNWEIRNPSNPFNKTDSRTIEFRVQVPPDG